MPVMPTFPGVYIEEIPSGVRTITGVATSITAFIGRAARGQVNQPVIVNSFADFERAFGGLQEDFPLSYAVRDFFQNGGGQALIVRLLHPNFATDAPAKAAAAVALAARSAADAPAAKAAADGAANAINGAASSSQEEKDAANAVAAQTDPPGDVQAAADDAAKKINSEATPNADKIAGAKAVQDAVHTAAQKAGATGAAVQAAADDAANKINSEAVPNADRIAGAKAVQDAVHTAATPTGLALADVKKAADDAAKTVTVDPAKSAAAKVQNDVDTEATKKGATIASVRAAGDKAAQAILDDKTKGKDEKDAATAVRDALDVAAAKAQAAFDEVLVAVSAAAPGKALLRLPTATAGDDLVLEAVSEGAWGNALTAVVDSTGITPAVAERYKPLTTADLFNLTIQDGNTGVQERYLALSVIKGSQQQVDRVLAAASNLVRVNGDLPAGIPKNTEKDKKTGKDVPIVVLGGDAGSDGGFLDDNDITDGSGLADNKRGLFALDKADLFNLLCLPADQRGEDTSANVYQKALTYCQTRRAMLIVDSPAAWSANKETAAATAIDQGKGLPSLNLTGEEARNAALFFPRIRMPDPRRNGQIDTFVPCGAVAGVFARTDATRGIWKAPAGLDATLSGVQELEVNLNDAENGQLNPLGINCLRFFPVAGRVVWGARTLRGADLLADEYKYIPIRRLALFIEESLYRGTQWVVFEPNDEPLWAQIRLNVGAFMQNLFLQGAFQGKTPRDAYLVKCDAETTTETDRNLGIVNIRVGFAPLKPAEFVMIQIQQLAGQTGA